MPEWKKNAVHRVEITGYTAEGLGVGRAEGRVVFVPRTIRGERWEVRLVKVNRSVAWGRGERLIQASPSRREPGCPCFGPCGGCQFRHMDYEEELWAKKQRVEDALSRIGGLELKLSVIHGAGESGRDRYRNKAQFPVARRGSEVLIGFYRGRSHEVLDVPDCLLQTQEANRLGRALKRWMEREKIPAYEEGTGLGLVRHLYVRTNRAGESLACVVVNASCLPEEERLVQELRRAEPGLAGAVLNINERDTNVILGDRFRTLWGRDWLEEELLGLTFRLSIPSFFQVNLDRTEVLYRRAEELAGLTGRETVLDLYCGTGTIGLTMARRANRLIGVEIVPQAVEDARENARRNGIQNAGFLCADAGQAAERLAAEGVRPDVVCVDPPRKGLTPRSIAAIRTMSPERVVYVSCDPATLARDAGIFSDQGYRPVRAEAVDMFPGTAHVETILLLTRDTGRQREGKS